KPPKPPAHQAAVLLNSMSMKSAQKKEGEPPTGGGSDANAAGGIKMPPGDQAAPVAFPGGIKSHPGGENEPGGVNLPPGHSRVTFGAFDVEETPPRHPEQHTVLAMGRDNDRPDADPEKAREQGARVEQVAHAHDASTDRRG
ncbi:hypothetical protein H0H92_013085, partial [Tricholoma furcatifolium]